VVLTAEKVYDVLKHMTDDDIRALGFNPALARPEWMVVTVLPVPPPAVRPPISMDSVTSAQDDLTFKLADVVRQNSDLKRKQAAGAPGHVIDDLLLMLQYHVATIIESDISGMPQSKQRGSGRVIKSIRARLKGKHGRIRGNLMGKRVDFSARSVITADPNISVNEARARRLCRVRAVAGG
jgi:DNA-directed RNA polymerase II subunit RPB1